MSHTTKDKVELLHRVRRLRGQVTAVEKALEDEEDCSVVLQRIAACRGAINSLMAEVLEGHVRHHILDPTRKPKTEKSRAAQELIDVVNTYLK
jgi:FrmR/RcnR family transcriptional regulator, repressor of frmRAB operon